MLLSAIIALLLSNALQAFHILLQIGAGTGLLFILRWFWWRINAASEIAAMVISFLAAVWFEFIHVRVGLPELIEWQRLVIGVIITTVGWITVTLISKPTDKDTLFRFIRLVRPGGPGWRRIREDAKKVNFDIGKDEQGKWDVPSGLLCVFLGLVMIYSLLFSIGFWIYSNVLAAIILTCSWSSSAFLLFRIWSRRNYRVK
jgi:hypothetical protein